jgi:hypothetical protein
MSAPADHRRASTVIAEMELILADKSRQSFGPGCLFRGDVRALVNAFRNLEKKAASSDRPEA